MVKILKKRIYCMFKGGVTLKHPWKLALCLTLLVSLTTLGVMAPTVAEGGAGYTVEFTRVEYVPPLVPAYWPWCLAALPRWLNLSP